MKSPTLFDERMRHSVADNMLVNFVHVVAEIAKRIKHLGIGQVWQCGRDFFRSVTDAPKVNYRARRDTSVSNNRLFACSSLAFDDVSVLG